MGWTNGSECEDFYFDGRTDRVRRDAIVAKKQLMERRRKSFRDLNMNDVVFTSVPQIRVCHTCQTCVSYMCAIHVCHTCVSDMCVRHVIHTCQTCVSYICVIHVRHKCVPTLFKQTFGSLKPELEDRTTKAKKRRSKCGEKEQLLFIDLIVWPSSE